MSFINPGINMSFLAGPQKGSMLALFIIGSLIVGGLFLAALTLIPPRYRKYVVIAITFIGGLYFSLEFLLPHSPILTGAPKPVASGAAGVVSFANWLTDIRPFIGNGIQIIWSFALFLGVLNLFQIHGKAIRKLTPGWYNSAAFFIAFFAITILGFMLYNSQHNLAAIAPSSPEYAAAQQKVEINGNVFNILFRGFLTSLDATMFSLIAFYIVSAAYRAFRIRSAEAVLMMIAAAIVMLTLVPVGVFLTNWIPATGFLSYFRLEKIGIWLLTNPNMTVQRAISFGVAVGSLAMGLRIWLSLERGSFFDRQL